ncbi:MAG TPA: hypothetical protein VK960_04780, partial [Acidimicrobiia bacterium]|nr:hypothetical protein [Acidimicrobiia bacterium]
EEVVERVDGVVIHFAVDPGSRCPDRRYCATDLVERTMHSGITGTEPWNVPNLVGGVVLFVLFVVVVSYAMTRSTRD